MAIVLPFNFNPDVTVQSTGSYTVPAGRYAFVSITISVHSTLVSNVGAQNAILDPLGNQSLAQTMSTWLEDGDAVTSSTSSGAPSGFPLFACHSTTAFAEGSALINGTAVMTLRANSFGTSSIASTGNIVGSDVTHTFGTVLSINASEFLVG